MWPNWKRSESLCLVASIHSDFCTTTPNWPMWLSQWSLPESLETSWLQWRTILFEICPVPRDGGRVDDTGMSLCKVQLRSIFAALTSKNSMIWLVWYHPCEITNCDLSVCHFDRRRVWFNGNGHTDRSCVELCRSWRLGWTWSYPIRNEMPVFWDDFLGRPSSMGGFLLDSETCQVNDWMRQFLERGANDYPGRIHTRLLTCHFQSARSPICFFRVGYSSASWMTLPKLLYAKNGLAASNLIKVQLPAFHFTGGTLL